MLCSVPVASDTTYTLSVEVKMSKAVRDGIFKPDSDLLYVVFDESLPNLMLVQNPGYLYSGEITEGLDSGATYHFRARINDKVYESVARQIVINPGNTLINVWWNDDPISTITFTIDMKYMAELGLFDPDSAYVELVGNMNNYQGSGPMERIDTTLVYRVRYSPDPKYTCIYRFRISGDTTIEEVFNRYLLVPDTILTVSHFFYNINPGKVSVTFYCDLEYQIKAGHYIRGTDYLDIVGTFNDWGGYDLLYDDNTDSIMSVTLLIDTSLISQGPITFKYRISGDWSRAELQGLPGRTYLVPDTGGVFSAWYDDKNPHIPTPPWAYDVRIQGVPILHEILSGIYSYENCNYISEGKSLYQWYRCDDSLMTNLVPIDSANYISYSIDTLDYLKWIVFEVIPVADSGDSATGRPVRVITDYKTGNVGISDPARIIIRLYPNPASDYLIVEGNSQFSKVDLISLSGTKIFSSGNISQKRCIIPVSALAPGMYLLEVITEDGSIAFARFIKI